MVTSPGWEYVSGVLVDDAGTEYALHVVTFRDGNAVVSHAAVRTRDGFMLSEELRTDSVSERAVAFGGHALEVVLAMHAPNVIELEPPARDGKTSHAFAPRCLAFGSIKINGRAIDVEGEIWYDRETLPAESLAAGWDWASVRLADGRSFYVYGLHGKDAFAVSYVDGALRKHTLRAHTTDSVLATTGRVYPTAIKFEVDGLGAFSLVPWFDDQEISSALAPPYYEGACDVFDADGQRAGYAFVEYAGRLAATERDLSLRWCANDKDAADLLRDAAIGSQRADDIVDEGKGTLDMEPLRDKSGIMLDVLTYALVRLPNNKFYQQHRARLEPLILSSSLYWDLSNYLVTLKNDTSRYYAYAYRELLEQVVGMCAYIVGGLDHARRSLREVHYYYHVLNADPFDEWWAEVKNG